MNKKEAIEHFERPPIGIMPKWLWDEQREWNLLFAIQRYRIGGLLAPKEWEDEYSKLLNARIYRNAWKLKHFPPHVWRYVKQ